MSSRTTPAQLAAELDKLRRKYPAPPPPPPPHKPPPTPTSLIPPGVRMITTSEEARSYVPAAFTHWACCGKDLPYGEPHEKCQGDPARRGFVDIPLSMEWYQARGLNLGVAPTANPPAKLEVTGAPCPCGRPFVAGSSHSCNLGGPQLLPHDQAVRDGQLAQARRLLGLEA